MKKFLFLLLMIFSFTGVQAFTSTDDVELKTFGINIAEYNGRISITKIDKLGPFGRYSFFRNGDIIIAINETDINFENIMDMDIKLQQTDDIWIKFESIKTGRVSKVHISLKKSLPMPNFFRK